MGFLVLILAMSSCVLVTIELMAMVFGSSLTLYALRAVQVWWLSQKVKNKWADGPITHRYAIVAMDIYTGGTEGNGINEDARKAIQIAQVSLESLGVRFEEIHHGAAVFLRNDRVWRDKIAQTRAGTADVIVVGDWRIWQPMNYNGPPYQALRFSSYRNNGAEIQRDCWELWLSSIRLKWWTKKILCQQCMLVVLQGLADTLKGPRPNPGYYYDTSKWPHEESAVK